MRIAGFGFRVKEKDRSRMMLEQMKQRTKAFALRVVRLTEAPPRGRAADAIGGQLLRSGMSVGSNYRAACRGRSTAVSTINTARGGKRKPRA